MPRMSVRTAYWPRLKPSTSSTLFREISPTATPAAGSVIGTPEIYVKRITKVPNKKDLFLFQGVKFYQNLNVDQ